MDITQQLLSFLGPIGTTLLISVLSFLFGLALGLPLAFLKVYQKHAGIIVDVYEKVFRGIPEPVLILMFYFRVYSLFSISILKPLFHSNICFKLEKRR